MNKKTRKLSRFPNEVRAKLEKFFVDKPPLVEQATRTWSRSEDNINEHICKGLKVGPFLSYFEILYIGYLLIT